MRLAVWGPGCGAGTALLQCQRCQKTVDAFPESLVAYLELALFAAPPPSSSPPLSSLPLPSSSPPPFFSHFPAQLPFVLRLCVACAACAAMLVCPCRCRLCLHDFGVTSSRRVVCRGASPVAVATPQSARLFRLHALTWRCADWPGRPQTRQAATLSLLLHWSVVGLHRPRWRPPCATGTPCHAAAPRGSCRCFQASPQSPWRAPAHCAPRPCPSSQT
mmetsp:Transcript_371/g.848  ORF Transcript_371/g.848 Transcript_371/m.848 type:complete len:218 (+) Transcript_371:378-1031(+)